MGKLNSVPDNAFLDRIKAVESRVSNLSSNNLDVFVGASMKNMYGALAITGGAGSVPVTMDGVILSTSAVIGGSSIAIGQPSVNGIVLPWYGLYQVNARVQFNAATNATITLKRDEIAWPSATTLTSWFLESASGNSVTSLSISRIFGIANPLTGRTNVLRLYVATSTNVSTQILDPTSFLDATRIGDWVSSGF